MTTEATTRAAIGAAITAASGLAADRVRWGRQGLTAARPSTPGAWISLLELGEDLVGRPYAKYERNPFVFADKPIAAVVTGDPGALTVPGHDLQTGDGPVRLATAGTLPGGLSAGVDYWVIRVDSNGVRLAPSYLAAVEAPAPIAISSSGVGAHALVDTEATVRAGSEAIVAASANGLRTVSVQCYGGDAVDDASPMAILRRVRAALELPAIRSALWASNVGLQRAASPRDVSIAVTPGRFEPRAVLEVAFYVPGPAVTATETIIESATVPLTVYT